ncbi:MAG: hypothetical protein AB8G86_04770 [Saprospiraceae bacterium]
MTPEELKFYIEQYQTRDKGKQDRLSSWSDVFLIETIQEGLLKNGYDISFTDKNGNAIEGKQAIDGLAGTAFKKAINDFEKDFRNNKFDKDNVSVGLKILPTADILKEKMAFYCDVVHQDQNRIKSYTDAIDKVTEQNSYSIEINIGNNTKSFTDEEKELLLRRIEKQLREKGFEGKGLYAGFYNGVKDISKDEGVLKDPNLTAYDYSQGIKAEYQFDAENGYNAEKLAVDKSKIEQIIKEEIKALQKEKSLSLPQASLEKIIEETGVNLNWSAEKYGSNQALVHSKNNEDKGRIV